jgi:hypoxanthine phosphoribosyltransferase
MDIITILDKTFKPCISSAHIADRVNMLADELNHDLKNQPVIFVGILNGAFMFASDLLKKITLHCTVSFLKFSSYEGTISTGTVNQLIGLNDEVHNKIIVIIEDIIESGNTLDTAMKHIKELNPKAIKVAGLLFKPDAYKYNYPIDYVGFTIPNDFVVGYGLDYKGYGRNLNEIYSIIDT